MKETTEGQQVGGDLSAVGGSTGTYCKRSLLTSQQGKRRSWIGSESPESGAEIACNLHTLSSAGFSLGGLTGVSNVPEDDYASSPGPPGPHPDLVL